MVTSGGSSRITKSFNLLIRSSGFKIPNFFNVANGREDGEEV